MRRISKYMALAVTALTICGCGKHKTSQGQSAPAPETSANTPDPASQNQNPAAQPVPTVDAQAGLAQANQAIKSRDYVKATDTLITLQRQPLNDQQAEALRMQMRQLQGALAGAVANGDPSAKAAADRLRASASGAGR